MSRRWVSSERNGPSVRGHHRSTPVAGLRNQIANIAARDVDDVDLRRLVLHVGVRRPVAVEHDRLAVGGPVDRRAAAELAGADAPFSRRQIPRGPTVAWHHEQMRKALVEESNLVLSKMQT